MIGLGFRGSRFQVLWYIILRAFRCLGTGSGQREPRATKQARRKRVLCCSALLLNFLRAFVVLFVGCYAVKFNPRLSQNYMSYMWVKKGPFFKESSLLHRFRGPSVVQNVGFWELSSYGLGVEGYSLARPSKSSRSDLGSGILSYNGWLGQNIHPPKPCL